MWQKTLTGRPTNLSTGLNCGHTEDSDWGMSRSTETNELLHSMMSGMRGGLLDSVALDAMTSSPNCHGMVVRQYANAL